MFDEAKRLIDLGLPIIPLCAYDHEFMYPKHIQMCKCAGKTPLIKNWQTRSSTSLEDVKEWDKQFKKFNIGVPLGEASGYVGIDIDGEYGEERLSEMSNGDIPDTWEFSTGAGRRLLYLIPPGTKTKKFKQANKEGGHEECALLCDGQQTVIPPSIHYTGRPYEWMDEHSPWDIDCAMAPEWLIKLIKVDSSIQPQITFDLTDIDIPTLSTDLASEFECVDFMDTIPAELLNNQAIVKTQKSKTGHKIVVTEDMLTQPIPEGQRDNTMTAIVGHYCANRDIRRMGKEITLQICMQHNMKYCDPPLEAESIKQKVNYFFDIELMKDAQYKQKQTNDKPVFEPSKLTNTVRNKLQEEGLIIHFDQNSKMYYYTSPTKGPWTCTRNSTLVSKWIRKVITDPVYGHHTWDKQSYIEEVRRVLEESYTEAYKHLDDFDLGAHSDELSKYIVVNEGMLDWKTGQITPWNPEYFTTVSYNLNYDPTADCPRFKNYLSEWLPDAQVRDVVQEFIGYCLIPNTKFRKALFLYGKGSNGKSMLLEFLQKFFKEHLSTLSYDNLFSRFGPANLKDKLVNIYDDTTVSFTKETSNLKNMIAGGQLEAEFKGKDHFTFINVARMIFSSQETPKTSDHSDAWYGRWFFVKFPNKFKPSNAKKTEIQTALNEELPGIFNWMIEGLKRLMENDGFSDSRELVVSSQEYRSQNDSVSMFMNHMCVLDKASQGTSLNTLYKIYVVWSEYEGLRPLSKRTFAERIEDIGYEKRKGYYDGKSGQTLIAHIIVNKDSEEYQENKVDYALALQNMG